MQESSFSSSEFSLVSDKCRCLRVFYRPVGACGCRVGVGVDVAGSPTDSAGLERDTDRRCVRTFIELTSRGPKCLATPLTGSLWVVVFVCEKGCEGKCNNMMQ